MFTQLHWNAAHNDVSGAKTVAPAIRLYRRAGNLPRIASKPVSHLDGFPYSEGEP